MKEIWKLIELFKEYVDKYSNDAKVLDEWEYVVIDDGQSFLYWTREYSYLTLISKKFGMVKWLVENDKIDFENNYLSISKTYIEEYPKYAYDVSLGSFKSTFPKINCNFLFASE